MADKKVVYIEGNVGAGKSTLLKFLQQLLDVQVFYEPHHLWQDIDGHNLLEQFFLDQRRWAFSLQSYVTVTQVQQLQDALNELSHSRAQLFERSVYAGRYCFARNAYEMGLMDELEWSLYKKMWDFQVQSIKTLANGFIYLRIPAQVCYERIQKRGRFEERPISLKYISNLEQKYDDWLLHKKGIDSSLLDVPVLVLEDDRDLQSNEQMQQDYVQKVEQFIQQIQK